MYLNYHLGPTTELFLSNNTNHSKYICHDAGLSAMTWNTSKFFNPYL